ncbi:hypothetical protein R6Q57_009331 [Mikania cordata]
MENQMPCEKGKDNFETHCEGYVDNSKEIQKEKGKDVTQMRGSKDYLRGEFAKFVKWFYKEHFNQKDKKYPPTLPNGCNIELLDLYMFVENEGGYERDSKNCKWGEIAIKMGFKEPVVINLMVIYQGYSDLMVWRYKIEKEDENKVVEPSCSYSLDVAVNGTSKSNENSTSKMQDHHAQNIPSCE